MHFITSTVAIALASLFITSTTAAVSAAQMQANLDALSDFSSQGDAIARSISLTNFFSTAPQLINQYRTIIETINNDVAASSKRRRGVSLLDRRQECLDVTDIEKCIEDLEELFADPGQILGDSSRRRRQATTPYTAAEQEAICSAFRGFVTTHQQLLATTISKHGLLSLTPFTAPLAAVLRVTEGAVDTLALIIIDSVPQCVQDATQNKNSLDTTLDKAINEYSA